ncbi:MAG: hypothetical protein AAF086_08240 [Planctomycetota bacterium]
MIFCSARVLAFCTALTSALCCLNQNAWADDPLTVAVLGFSAPDSEDNHVGQMINDTIEVLLSGEDGFTLVNRSEMMTTLSEQGLNLAGVVDAGQATRVGHVVGAQLLVTGKAFELGESRIISAKLIGTETTRIKAVMAKGELDQPIDALVFEVAEQLAAVMRDHGSELVASSRPTDPLPALIEQLAGRELPTFAIVIPEEHRQTRAVAPGPVPDPAVETELKIILLQAGVKVQDVQDNALADWVNRFEEGDNTTWPRTLEGVDLVIIGEAFSESGGTLGQLRLASARAEINVIARQNGEIVFADRATTRGVDLAEEIAGKTALEKAGRRFAINLLTYLEANPQTP